jgi:hypothetical protein
MTSAELLRQWCKETISGLKSSISCQASTGWVLEDVAEFVFGPVTVPTFDAVASAEECGDVNDVNGFTFWATGHRASGVLASFIAGAVA